MALHEAIAHLEVLVGTWRGRGHGSYPTIADFDYLEEVVFADVGKSFLVYDQRTTSLTGGLMHLESGYLRSPDPATVEIVLAQPGGLLELGLGTCELADGGLEVVTDASVRCTPTAKRVDRVARRIRVDGDRLTYTVHMAALGHELATHLTGELERARG